MWIDLKTSDPTLEIKTDSLIGSDDVMDLRFYTSQQEVAGGIKIFFKTTPLIHLHWCTNFRGINFDTSLPPDLNKVWRILQISGIRVKIYCNEVEVLDYTLSDNNCPGGDWKNVWKGDVRKMAFSWGSAADFFRPYGGNCYIKIFR